MKRYLLPLGVALLSLSSIGNSKLLFLNATEVKYLSQERTVEALKGVEVHYGVYYLKADRLRYLKDKGVLVAEGHVFFTDRKGVFLRAKRAVYYIREKVVELYDVEGKIKEGYFKAKFARLKGDVYLLRSLCASKCPDFSAQVCAKKFVYRPKEGEGTAYSATLKIEKLPILYTPYYAFLTKRKSGFLPPKLGIDSYGDFIYRQPYFWAIDSHSDLTLTGDYRSGGLYGAWLQYRKFFAYNSYLETLNQFYYDDAYPGKWWQGREEHRRHRYLLSGKGYRGNLSFKWEYPSDIYYYYDVFFFDKELHYKSFAESYIQYSLDRDLYTLNLKGAYFYNLKTTDRSKDLATIPDIYFYLKPLPLGGGFSTDLTSELTDFYTENRQLWRWRLVPELKFQRVLGTTPVTGYLKPFYIYYSSRRYGNRHHIAGFALKLKSLLYDFDLIRTSSWNLFSSWEGVYEFQPFEEKNTPSFDYFDLLTKKNMVTLRGVNTLHYRGREVLNLLVEQPYNFYEGYNFPTDGAYVRGKLLPLKVYYNLYPSPSLGFSGKVYYDHQRKQVVYNSVSVSWEAIRTLLSKLALRASYSLSKDHLGKRQAEQYSYGLSWRWRRISLSLDNYHDAVKGKDVKTDLQVGYRKDCWSLGVRYEREYNYDSGKYQWRAFLVLSVFANPFNVLISGGER